MSKQRLQELEAQYNACIHQQVQAMNTNQSVINEINQLRSQVSNVHSNTKVDSTVTALTSLMKVQGENNSTTEMINNLKSSLNHFTSLLDQYNEYVPPIVNSINVNENGTNVEQVGEIAAFIERANS